MSEPQYILCPYCGHLQRSAQRCGECGGLFEPLSRKATQIAMGPWYIRDKRLPFRPGCSFEVLKRQIQAGKITANSVLRGPTTRQFWAVARHVPGVAHLLGYCHKCNAKVSPQATRCPSCQAVFKEPAQRNELGLAYASADAAKLAQRELDDEVRGLTQPAKAKASTSATATAGPAKAVRPGEDLLQEVLTSPSHAGAGDDMLEQTESQGPGSAAPEALDFTPAGDEPLPRMNPTVVLLISLNALFLVLVALLLWWLKSHG